MSYQNIDATLSAADAQVVKDALATIVTKLPFLVTLTNEERKALFKTGSNRLSLVEDAANTVQNFPDILPASFDKAGFLRDFDLFKALTEIKLQFDSVASQIDDTCLALGSETGQQSLQVYKYGQTAANNTPGIKPVIDKLGTHFARTSKAKPAAKPTT